MTSFADEIAWLLTNTAELVRGGGDTDVDQRTVPDLDWRSIAAMATTSRTAALLGWAYRERRIAMPEWLAEVAVATYRYNVARHRILVDEIRRVSTELPDETRALVRKGAHLASMYPNPGARPFSDIDLLVHPEDEATVVSALERAGFAQGRLSPDRRSLVPWDRASKLYFRLATNALPYFLRFIGPDDVIEYTQVDISTKLLPPRFGDVVPVDDLWAARRNVNTFPMPVPSPLDLFVDLCVNLYMTTTTLSYVREGRHRRLIPYLDLLLVTDRSEDLTGLPRILSVHPELVRPISFALGNLDRLFPGRDWSWMEPATRTQLDGLSELDAVGALELDDPYIWSSDIRDRMFAAPIPEDLPEPEFTLQ